MKLTGSAAATIENNKACISGIYLMGVLYQLLWREKITYLFIFGKLKQSFYFVLNVCCLKEWIFTNKGSFSESSLSFEHLVQNQPPREFLYCFDFPSSTSRIIDSWNSFEFDGCPRCLVIDQCGWQFQCWVHWTCWWTLHCYTSFKSSRMFQQEVGRLWNGKLFSNEVFCLKWPILWFFKKVQIVMFTPFFKRSLYTIGQSLERFES